MALPFTPNTAAEECTCWRRERARILFTKPIAWLASEIIELMGGTSDTIPASRVLATIVCCPRAGEENCQLARPRSHLRSSLFRLPRNTRAYLKHPKARSQRGENGDPTSVNVPGAAPGKTTVRTGTHGSTSLTTRLAAELIVGEKMESPLSATGISYWCLRWPFGMVEIPF